MKRKALTLLITVFILSITVFAGVIKDGSLSASSDGTNITIRWVSEDETSVSGFVLERKAGVNGMFAQLTDVIQPKGNNSSYQYVDESAFRPTTESLYQYRLRVLFSNGMSPFYSGAITVSHRTSAVRSTWGSIKAMFR